MSLALVFSSFHILVILQFLCVSDGWCGEMSQNKHPLKAPYCHTEKAWCIHKTVHRSCTQPSIKLSLYGVKGWGSQGWESQGWEIQAVWIGLATNHSSQRIKTQSNHPSTIMIKQFCCEKIFGPVSTTFYYFHPYSFILIHSL